mmetsp:Transcript_4687/g.12326  ORF Transcript_4687/g.12326 Transcript_4687/m.12326 type:complete len:131 (+) Transcript_4687:3-395(+)
MTPSPPCTDARARGRSFTRLRALGSGCCCGCWLRLPWRRRRRGEASAKEARSRPGLGQAVVEEMRKQKRTRLKRTRLARGETRPPGVRIITANGAQRCGRARALPALRSGVGRVYTTVCVWQQQLLACST